MEHSRFLEEEAVALILFTSACPINSPPGKARRGSSF